MKCICFTFPILSSPDNQWKISDIRFKFMNSKQKQRQAVLHLKKSIQEREQPCQSFAPDQISSSFWWQGFQCFLPKVGWICCSPYVQLQGAGAILGGNCGNCRSQVSPGAPSNPSQLYSPAPSSNKSSVTKAAPFWPFATQSVDNQRWQSLAVDKNHWDLGMPALQLSAASLGSIWQIWWQLPTNHWQVSNRSGMGFAQEVTASCKSRGDKQRNPLGLWENRGELWTTAVYGVADGWELTGSVEG